MSAIVIQSAKRYYKFTLKNMKPLGFLVTASLLLSFGLPLPSLSETTTQCEQYQEVFGFQIPNYVTQNQGGAILNINVSYRLMPEAISKNDYPDFVPMTKDIEQFFANYPNQGESWEMVNKKLVKLLLDKYPQMSSLVVEINVNPTPKWPFPRFSAIRSTRPQSCPLISF